MQENTFCFSSTMQPTSRAELARTEFERCPFIFS